MYTRQERQDWQLLLDTLASQKINTGCTAPSIAYAPVSYTHLLCIIHPTGRGEVILQNVLGLGTDIIVTADWPEEQDKEDRYEQ